MQKIEKNLNIIESGLSMKKNGWFGLKTKSFFRHGNFFSIHKLTIVSGLVFSALMTSIFAQGSDSTKYWVGTWGCAPYEATTNTPPVSLTNNTLRQIVRVSIGGDTLRVKFSNITCARAVTMKKVNIAVSPDGTKSAITASTVKELKFNGSSSVTMNAKTEVYSDPVAFDLKPNMRLAITIYYGDCQTSSDMTHHYGSRTDSYILTGDKTSSADFSGATSVERWYTICNIDVLAPKGSAAVGIIGNSITDGYGLHGGLQNRWTDAFSEKLLKNQGTGQVGVVNMGIGATLVTQAGNGAKSGVDRFEHDVLSIPGIQWVIIFYGVNDIGGNVSADNIINGIKKMVTAAHAKNLKVYGATITPFNGNSYYSPAHEQVRSNVNKWIRTDTSLDGFLDFDKAVRNSSDTTRLQQTLSNDWLHPSAAGYKVIGESIDPKYFIPPVTTAETVKYGMKTNRTLYVKQNGSSAFVTFTMPKKSFVSLKMYSMQGKEIAELAGRSYDQGAHTIQFEPIHSARGMYILKLRSGSYLDSRSFIFQ